MSDYVDPYEAPFLYTAKASRSERDAGCHHLYWKYEDGDPVQITREEYDQLKEADERVSEANLHPTVKALEVMEWLVDRLTEEGDTVLDPFTGSGTTGIAALNKLRNARLIELDEDGSYEPIIRGRLKAAKESYLKELAIWKDKPDIEVPTDDEVEEEGEEEVGFGELFR